jgi:16S rRNA (adenine1518-N6/adenine1519-N6)-dimethyltransferase
MARGGMPPTLKRLGQHFLTDQRVLDRIADAVAPPPERVPTIIEIGPGRGALTDRLLARADRLITIELDRQLVPILRQRYAEHPHVSVVEADVLEINLAELAGGPYALAGNVPYYITTPILFHALRRPRAHRAVYLVQREVAERIASPPGSKEYGALSVNVQALARAELLFRVPAGAFSPPPKVESAVVRIEPLATPIIEPHEEERFRTMVQEAFGLRRKQMRRVVRTMLHLDAPTADRLLDLAGVDPETRPETLSASDFARILRATSVVAPGQGEG